MLPPSSTPTWTTPSLCFSFLPFALWTRLPYTNSATESDHIRWPFRQAERLTSSSSFTRCTLIQSTSLRDSINRKYISGRGLSVSLKLITVTVTIPCCAADKRTRSLLRFRHLVPVAVTCKNLGRHRTIYIIFTPIRPLEPWKKFRPSKPFRHFPGYRVTSVTSSEFEGLRDAWLTNWTKCFLCMQY